MAQHMNRRHWLKSGALMAGAFTLGNPFEFTNPALARTAAVKAADASPWDFKNMKARLTSNENPFGPSPKAQEAMMSAIKDSWMYAKLGQDELRKMIAKMWDVSEEHVMMGAGSTEILMAAAQHFGHKGSKILAADLTYMSLIRRACFDYGAELVNAPLTRDLDYDFNRMSDAVRDDISLVYLCNPNNPTGKLANTAEMKAFCAEASRKKPVFVDEAYIDYQKDPAEKSMISLVKEGKDVIVARTFSKVHAMAGLRIGYCIASPENIQKLKRFGTDGNGMARPSVYGAIETLKDEEFMNYSRKMNAESKAHLYKTLTQAGYEYIPSETNFVLFPIRMDGDRFVMEMMKRGVGLKRVHFRNQHYCRVSIGTLKNMEIFAEAFSEIS
ncbi:MAG: pyridoxal phosphate-dependent aminotransferase [Cyclobacteriaceae bacterium]